MTIVACIGLGQMGLGIATRLLSAGHEVSVYDPAAGSADALSTMGAVHASNPRDACADAEAILAVVRDDHVSRAVWLGDDGVLAADLGDRALALECSTLSYGWVMAWAKEMQQHGLRPIDCTVTGMPDATAAGALVLNVGAAADDLEIAGPLLDDIAEVIFHLGPTGSGTAYKLTANLLASVQLVGVAESLAVAEGLGLDLDRVIQALAKDPAASRLATDNLRRMADDHHDRDLTFPVSLRRKDTAYGLALAQQAGINVPFATAALAALDKLKERGWDDLNESKIFDLFRRHEP